LPRGAQFLADLILRPAEEPPLHHEFNGAGGIPAANAWSDSHQVPLSVVLEWAERRGFRVENRLPWGAPVFLGQVDGRDVRVAAYTEPSLFWERTHGMARSWNVMADGTCLASLEDRGSRLDESTLMLAAGAQP
jgi:hypothetical protein